MYYTLIEYENKLYKGITNVGYNPTVEDKKLNIETHILDFNKDIYEENIVIYFQRELEMRKILFFRRVKRTIKKDKNFAKRQSM